jgi:hypothetical protein
MVSVVLFAVVMSFAGGLQAQWSPSGNSTTADIYRTGKVGVGYTSAGPSLLSVKNAASMDGISVDGTNPALLLRNSSVLGYLGLVTSAGTFFTGTSVNDLILRSESAKIHIGQGTGAPTLTVSGSNVGVGTISPSWPFHVVNTDTTTTTGNRSGAQVDYTVTPSAAQSSGTYRTALYGYSTTPASNTNAAGRVAGVEGDFENYGNAAVSDGEGMIGWVYNANASTSIDRMVGTNGSAESDAGSVTYMDGLFTWLGVYGGTVGNLYGVQVSSNIGGGTVTNNYGIYSAIWGNATNKYGVFIKDVTGTATNDFGLYQEGATHKNYFAGNVGIGTTSPASPLTVNGVVYSQSGGFKFPDGTVQTTAATSGGGGGTVTAANVSSGNFGANTSGGNYTFPARVGVGSTAAPANQLHVTTATNMDGIAVDGSSNPAINFRNAGTTMGYLGLATTANAFFAGSTSNDLVLRSESAKIHLGQGMGAPTLTVSGGNVGIGTTAPYYPFHVSTTNTDTTGGSAQSGGNRAWQGAAEVDLVVKPTAAQASGAVRTGHEVWSKVDSTNTYAVGEVRGSEGDAENYGSGPVTLLRGNEGWAYNANPSASVDSIVGSSAYAESDGGTVSSLINLHSWSGVYGGTTTNQYGAMVQIENGGGVVTNQYGVFSGLSGNATNRYGIFLRNNAATVANDFAVYQETPTAKNYFGGNVGIGTTSPTAPLTVNGQIYSQSGGIKFPDGTIQTTAATSGGGGTGTVTAANVSSGAFGSGGAGGNYSFPAILTIGSSVGIGPVSTPIALLDIRKSIVTDAAANLLTLGYSGTQSNRSVSVQQIGNAGTASQYVFLNGGLGASSTTAAPTFTSSFAPTFGIESNDSGMSMVTAAAGTNIAPVRALTVNSAGHIGIGVAPSADYVVDITGSLRATDVIGADYQDVAEWVPAGETLTPGMVVVLNRKHNNEVLESRASYDTSVAGVVSEHPGVVLGKGGPDKAKIATTGRVKVRVDASKNPIEIGDLLVTSEIAGMAMKSEPMEINGRRFHQPGTIIGKALEPLPSGTGEILVLLSLQ